MKRTGRYIGLLITICCLHFPLGVDGLVTCEAKSEPDIGQNLTCDTEDCSESMMNNSKHQIPANLTYFSAENTDILGGKFHKPALQIRMEVQLRPVDAEMNYLKIQTNLNSPGNSKCKRIILNYPSLSQSLKVNLKVVWGPVAEETVFNVSTGIMSGDENLLTTSVQTGKRFRARPGDWTTKVRVNVIQIGNLFRVECEFLPAPAEFPIHYYRISLCEVKDARHYPSCRYKIATNVTDMNVVVFETTRVGDFTVKVNTGATEFYTVNTGATDFYTVTQIPVLPSSKGQRCACGGLFNQCYACSASYSNVFSLVKSDMEQTTSADIEHSSKLPNTGASNDFASGPEINSNYDVKPYSYTSSGLDSKQNTFNHPVSDISETENPSYSSMEPLNSHDESSTVHVNYDQNLQVTPRYLPTSSNSFPLYIFLPLIFGIVIPAFGITLYFSICQKQKLKQRTKTADEKRSKQRHESTVTGTICQSLQECTTKYLCLIYAEDGTKHTSVISHFASVLIRYFHCEVTCCPWQNVLAGQEVPIHKADFIVLINSKTAHDFYITLQGRKDNQGKGIREYLQGEDVFLERLQKQTEGPKFVPTMNALSLTFAYTSPSDQIKDDAIIHNFECFRDFNGFISHIHKVKRPIIEEYLKRADVTLEIEKLKNLVKETTLELMSHVEGNKNTFGNNIYGTSIILDKPSVQETTDHEITKRLGNFLLNVNDCQSLFDKVDSVSEVVRSSPYTDRSCITKTDDYILNEYCATNSHCAKPFSGDLGISFHPPVGSVSGDISSAQQAEAMVDINKKYNIDLKTHFITPQKYETFENDGNQNGNKMEMNDVQCGRDCRNNQIVQTTSINESRFVTESNHLRQFGCNQSNFADIFIAEEFGHQNALNRSDIGAVDKVESNAAILHALTVHTAEHDGEKKLPDNYETQTIFRISV